MKIGYDKNHCRGDRLCGRGHEPWSKWFWVKNINDVPSDFYHQVVCGVCVLPSLVQRGFVTKLCVV